MNEFRDQDLTGAHFERVSLRGATFRRVHLNDASLRAVDLSGADVRAAMFHGARMRRRRGVVLHPDPAASQLRQCCLGWPDGPWHPLAMAPLDLPWDEAPGWDGIPWDRDARPSLEEVLTVRRERQGMVRDVMADLTDDQLASEVTRTEPGWPQMENLPVSECLLVVLNEEWEHRLYAERDLTALEAED